MQPPLGISQVCPAAPQVSVPPSRRRRWSFRPAPPFGPEFLDAVDHRIALSADAPGNYRNSHASERQSPSHGKAEAAAVTELPCPDLQVRDLFAAQISVGAIDPVGSGRVEDV